MDYLPKDATIEEACNWLQAKTGQTWTLARLLECHLTPHFWLDYKPGYPAIYGDKIEGYQTRMIFQGDLCRLESDRGDALVNMFTAHDGTLVKVQPGLRVPLSELRFKRESVERVAEIINKTAQNAATPAPVVADSASDAPLDAPQPVTTGNIAYAFDGLRGWNEKAWKDTLGSPPKWLEACIALRGQRGIREHHWNPVLIGAALVHKGHAQARSIRARFQTKPQLQDWLEAWKTYEADNFDAL
jgi:hypothetical protein